MNIFITLNALLPNYLSKGLDRQFTLAIRNVQFSKEVYWNGLFKGAV